MIKDSLMRQNSEILITGGTGVLGKELVTLLNRDSIPAEIASRTNRTEMAHWCFIDLATGEGIKDAIRNKKVIFHLASETKKLNKKTEVEGTKLLLEEAKANNISHFVYISIVGVEKVSIPYYRYKRLAEKKVITSGVPYTILRTTQFYYFMDFILGKMFWPPIGFLPKRAKFQPIEARSVAKILFSIGQKEPLNKIREVGGPQIMTLHQLAEIWLHSHKKKKPMVNFPLFGRLKAALMGGELTCKEMSKEPGSSWQEWLSNKYVTRE